MFTLYNTNVNRLRAEEDIRLLYVLASSDSADAFKTTQARLQKAYGEPLVQQRHGIIPPESGAYEKLKRLQNVR